MNLTKEYIYKNLQKQFYVKVPFTLSSTEIMDAVKSFFKFLEEPLHIRSHIDFSIAPQHRRGEVGFRHRNPEEDIFNDSKDFFQFHPALFEKYSDFLQAHPIVDDFVRKAHIIWDVIYKTIGNILEKFEEEFPGICNKVFNTKYPHILLRFLRYNWQNSGKYLAKPHFDAGSFTLGVAESCPGLRIGSCPEDLELITHEEKSAIFMLSSNFHKIINTDKFLPAWHDVIQIDETLIGKPFARWAVVAFIEAHGVEALPRTETHKYALGY